MAPRRTCAEKDMWTTQGDEHEDEEYLLSELLEQMVPGDDDELRRLKKRGKAIEAVLIELRDDDKLVKFHAGSINKARSRLERAILVGLSGFD